MATGARFVFERFELDSARRRLTASGEPVAISDRHLDVLLLLVARAGQIVSKDDLLQAGWQDVAVGDNSLEQAISSLRRLLGSQAGGIACIETMPRRGYRFAVPVSRGAPRATDAGLDALLAPHRAFIEGRAALETLEAKQIAPAREVFEEALRAVPDHASAHLGLASACILQFEMTRADSTPDAAALAKAVHHAREACRLDPGFGEAWATLGFVLDRAGDRLDAAAAARRAVSLEPDNWRHQFRLALVCWGEERLRAAQRTLALLPAFPLAHWLAATVHVARNVLDEADRELAAALASGPPNKHGESRFNPVALHWLAGLVQLARGDDARALASFEAELACEGGGHLYARECCANTWYAIGALALRQGRRADAVGAFEHALQRVVAHPMAAVGRAAAATPAVGGALTEPMPRLARTNSHGASVDTAMVHAARLVVARAHVDAARVLDDALTAADAGPAGWLLPVEPLLHVTSRPDVWASALARLRNRAV